MVRSVVHVQLILVVKVLGGAEEAVWVLLSDVLVEGLVLVIWLLKYEYGLMLEAQFTEVAPVHFYNMLPQ
jgi:hypothetical protein